MQGVHKVTHVFMHTFMSIYILRTSVRSRNAPTLRSRIKLHNISYLLLYHLSLWEITIVLKNKKRMLMIYRDIKLTKKNYQFLHIFVVFANEEVIIKKRAIYSLRSYRYQSFLDYRMLIHPFCVSNCISHIFFF